MRINADFAMRAVVTPDHAQWVESPMPGVQRCMLDRIGTERARATTIVCYAPGARFPEHVHDRGEEFLVLDGVFSDEAGDYAAGAYVRNPPGSRHAPWSDRGCTLFVKLRQFEESDQERVVIDSRTADFLPGQVPGLEVLPLHSHGTEQVALVRWAPGTWFRAHRHSGGEEILVLDGSLEDEHGRYPPGTWLRSPHLSSHEPFSTSGCLIYVKTGHLARMVSDDDATDSH